MKKGIKFRDSSVLNFILFSKSLNFLKFLDKLEEAKCLFKKKILKLEQEKRIFENYFLTFNIIS